MPLTGGSNQNSLGVKLEDSQISSLRLHAFVAIYQPNKLFSYASENITIRAASPLTTRFFQDPSSTHRARSAYPCELTASNKSTPRPRVPVAAFSAFLQSAASVENGRRRARPDALRHRDGTHITTAETIPGPFGSVNTIPDIQMDRYRRDAAALLCAHFRCARLVHR